VKEIEGFEGQYAITKDGKVWSFKTNKWISIHRIYSGYERVTLRDSKNKNKAHHFLVHRLVANAYLENPDGKLEVNHINSIRDDNKLENLEWATRSENNRHAWNCGNKTFVKTDKFVRSVRENAKIARNVRMSRYAT